MTLFEVIRDKQWLEMSCNVANLTATWVVSNDSKLPKETEIGRLASRLTGAVWASIQNKHATPGFCTSSEDPLFKDTNQRATIDMLNLCRMLIVPGRKAYNQPEQSWDALPTAMRMIEEAAVMMHLDLPVGVN